MFGSTRVMTDTFGNICYDADFYPFGREKLYTDTCPQNYKFTGKERDPESNLDNFGARYYSSSLGRFMTPDPLGGELIDPQTLNRYSYVRNNPESLTDPTGLDCVYVNQDQTQAEVVTGGCSEGRGGIHVNGTVNLHSFKLTAGTSSNSLAFNYRQKSTGASITSSWKLPSLRSPGEPSPNSDIGSWGAAVNVFSQIGRNPAVLMVSTGRGIASFYGASAAGAAGGLGLAELAPSLRVFAPEALAKLAAAVEVVQQLAFEKATDPEVLSFLHDLAQGYTPGPAPYTFGGLVGLLTGDLQNRWTQISDGIQNSYEEIKASVPH